MSDAQLPPILTRWGGSAPPALLPIAAPVRRQRSKLWELNGSIHCSIIGTCLTTGELRRAMAKALNLDVTGFSDHDLHSQAVGLCSHHSPAAKLLQKTLDRQHEMVVRRFARLTGEAEVMEAWAEYRRAGDIPGAYWAVLTHPDLGHSGMRRAFGDVHMLSHLVGAANRADIRRLTALEEENATLRAKVGRQQARLHEAITSRDATIRRLGSLAASQMTVAAGQDDDDALAGLRHIIADLQGRLDREAARHARLATRAAEMQSAAEAWKVRTKAAEDRYGAAERELAALERHKSGPGRQAMVLPAGCILYVGGRPGTVEQARAVLSMSGGALLVHDGGRHDNPSLLPGLIGQADLVAFPVDCVSHDAALTVKRLCRQLGKVWAPLRSSGLGSFLAMLADSNPQQEVTP